MATPPCINFGSPGYCSPERLTRSEVDQQSDLWAVGATLYEMLAGVPPYQAERHAQAGEPDPLQAAAARAAGVVPARACGPS